MIISFPSYSLRLTATALSGRRGARVPPPKVFGDVSTRISSHHSSFSRKRRWVSAPPSTHVGLNYIRQQYLDLADKPVAIVRTEAEYRITLPLL